MSSSNADPYVLANGTLRNELGLTDAAELLQVEAMLTRHRYALLRTDGPQGPLGFSRFLQTHHYLFQDVYSWAGEVRSISLAKAEFDGGPLQYFLAPSLIQTSAAALFGRLAAQNYLQGSSRLSFVRHAAQFFAQLKQLHTFREGNGRTQRAFMQAVARAAGHELRFDVISRERMISASVEGMSGPPAQFERMLDEISDPARVAPLLRAIKFFERNDFDWNDRYLTTTIPGVTYEGLLIGRDSGNFMLANQEYIYIGNSADLTGESDSQTPITVTARTKFI